MLKVSCAPISVECLFLMTLLLGPRAARVPDQRAAHRLRAAGQRWAAGGGGLHSSTSQYNLSRLRQSAVLCPVCDEL